MGLTKNPRAEDREFLNSYYAKGCLACSERPSDPCHIRGRGAGGPDTEWNVIPLCRKHHTEQHTGGWYVFASKYPRVYAFLLRNGWSFDASGRIWNDKLKSIQE